ncbi:hypothetical protein C8R44DRAFT_992193 [Mycena epipterygia]|nr:hypothetical protein C8R44DRAFT_992193 [Mycena epipterygia]
MAPALLARLFCCCIGSRARRIPEVESAVIPNETSRLIQTPSSPVPTIIDHQALSDKFSSIVRAKEGKMVSVSARAPFTIHSSSSSSTAFPTHEESEPSFNTAPDSDAHHMVSTPRATMSRRPPVLVMTPARVGRGPETPYMQTHILYSSSPPAGSRASSSSSLRRPRARAPSAHSTQSNSTPSMHSGKARNSTPKSDTARLPSVGVSAGEVAESTSEVQEEMQITPAYDAQGITFSWSDT